MICEKCGKELDDDAKFCDVCGAKIDNTPEADITNKDSTSETISGTADKEISNKRQYPDSKPTPASSNSSNKTSKNNNKKGIIALLLVLLAVIVVYIVIPKSDKSSDSGNKSSSPSNNGGDPTYDITTEDTDSKDTTTEEVSDSSNSLSDEDIAENEDVLADADLILSAVNSTLGDENAYDCLMSISKDKYNYIYFTKDEIILDINAANSTDKGNQEKAIKVLESKLGDFSSSAVLYDNSDYNYVAAITDYNVIVFAYAGNEGLYYDSTTGDTNGIVLCGEVELGEPVSESIPNDNNEESDDSTNTTETKTEEADDDFDNFVEEASNNGTTESDKKSDEDSPKDISSAEEIQRITNVKATCETDTKACIVNVDEDDNPYDVVWDYGDEYDKLVEACDWSLVFDADYYKSTFPALADLYHDNDELLLKHFQTVGIHEGRQGSANFNVGAYVYNNTKNLCSYFNKNYAGYYFYYMLNYKTEKNTNTIAGEGKYSNKVLKNQYKICLTIAQQIEWEDVCEVREDNDLYAYELNSELIAWANYRAYINMTTDYKAHEWFFETDHWAYVDKYWGKGITGIGENTITGAYAKITDIKNCVALYKKSKPHYDAIKSIKNDYFGVSNTYISTNYNQTSNFETFLNGTIE